MNNVLNGIMGVNEASVVWGISKTTIRDLCRRGEIEATAIDGTWAILKEQPEKHLKIIAMLQENEHLYYIAKDSPDEKLINLIKGSPLSMDQSIAYIFDGNPNQHLSSRALNSLIRSGIDSVGRLLNTTFNQLSPIRNLGDKALSHTFDCLDEKFAIKNGNPPLL